MSKRRIHINVKLLGPYWCHVWAIVGPYFGYFYNIFASRYLKLLKFSPKSHACHIEDYILIFNYWGHVLAILGPCFGYFYNIFTSRCLKLLKFLVKSHACQIEECTLIFNYGDQILDVFRPYFVISLLVNAWNYSKCHWRVMHAK